jgi:hypothetical protein
MRGAEGGGVGKVLKGIRPDVYKPPNFNPAPMGNAVAAATKCGPGGSRVNYGKSGQQGTYGSVNPGAGRITNTKGQWPDKR